MKTICCVLSLLLLSPAFGFVVDLSREQTRFLARPIWWGRHDGLPVSQLNAKEDNGDDNDEEDMLSLAAFQKAKEKTESQKEQRQATAVDEDFDGYQMRDIIFNKWGACYDLDFNRVDSFGFRKLYLNVMPFCLGRRPFRHETELDYLCHLQAVVEILQKYNQLEYILYQIQDTDKKPRAGTVPIVAVPLRLDLSADEVKQIMNN